jgi:hypothetical protein
MATTTNIRNVSTIRERELTHFDVIQCSDCNTTCVMHADGSIACSCAFVDEPDTDAIPAAWNTTRENIHAMLMLIAEISAVREFWRRV